MSLLRWPAVLLACVVSFSVAAAPAVVDVRGYGARGDGTTDDADAIQRAYDAVSASGGEVHFPAGTYLVSRPVRVPSHTRTTGSQPASLVVAAKGFDHSGIANYAMFVNAHYAGTRVTSYTLDRDISFDRMSFSYVNLPKVPGGGTHAIRMAGVTHVSVTNSTFAYGNDATAFITCDDTDVSGNTAKHIENAAFDNWGGPHNARIVGNYMEPFGGTMDNAVFFNAGDGSMTDSRTAQNLTVTGNTFFGGINLDTMGSNDRASGVRIEDNRFDSKYIVIGRGAISGTIISRNTIARSSGGNPAIWIDQGPASGSNYSGDPTGTVIVNNRIENVVVSPVNLGAIRVFGGGLIQGNSVQGSYPHALYLSRGQYRGTGNALAAGSQGTVAGTLLPSVRP